MSSKYVRDMVVSWLEDISMSIPYHSTINEEQNPSDDMWSTVKFSSSFRDRLTFCEGITSEEGEVEVRYSGEAGVGDGGLLEAIEADMLLLMAQRDLSGKLVLLQRSAPFEFGGGSADRWYGLSIYIDYQFYE